MFRFRSVLLTVFLSAALFAGVLSVRPVAADADPNSPTQDQAEAAAPAIVINRILFNGRVWMYESDEFVEIKNVGKKPVNLRNWRLSDKGNKHTYRFPAITMQPGQVCRVYTNRFNAKFCGLNWSFGYSAIWNNDGDEATLKNSQGRVIDRCAYEGSKRQGATARCYP